MHAFILWVGCAGAWFLVAGPLFQAAVELHEQQVDRDQLAAAKDGVPEPPRVSAWWWLVPPVKYLLERRAGRAYRAAVIDAMPVQDRESFVDYMNKATGWLLVAVGGVCIAAKETWELVEHLEGPVWLWLVVVVGLFLASAAYAAGTVGRGDELKGRSPRRPAPPA